MRGGKLRRNSKNIYRVLDKKDIMKQFSIILGMVTLAVLTSCSLSAQNPAISNKYADKEIANFIQNFEMSNHRDVTVDSNLLQRFTEDFPVTHSAEWESNGEIYEVEFEIRSRDFQAYYDKEGNLLMYKQEIPKRELPINVKNTAKAKYPQFRFEDDLEKIVKGTQTFYKIEMERGDMDVTVFILNTGELINK